MQKPDKVDHSILLNKLKSYGVTEKYIKWIQCFLTNRFQTVHNNGFHSYTTPVMSGVPQGSVLGPLLFIIYINDLQSVISGARMFTFADDTKLVSKISSMDDALCLQINLDLVIKWSKRNNMELNINKFEYINHKSITHNNNLNMLDNLPFSKKNFNYSVSNSFEICKTPSVRDLGVTVDEELNWKLHIEKVTKSCRQLCGWILSIFHTRDKTTMLTIFNSLVISKLDYCCEIWNPYQIQQIIKIEQIQRAFTSRIAGLKEDNYWNRLKKLEIMSLQRRREKIILIHVWKILNKLYPNSINLEFKLHTRTNSTKAIIKPLPKIRGRILTGFDMSFTIRAAKLWNILPANLTNVSSLNSFKAGLAKFLTKIPDQPPLPGYPYKCDNSLINTCA